MAPPRLSGLQSDVLKLYRNLLRTAMEKDPVGSFRLRPTVSERFRERAYSLEKNNIDGIEHYIRYGYKQKKMMEMSGFSAASAAKISR